MPKMAVCSDYPIQQVRTNRWGISPYGIWGILRYRNGGADHAKITRSGYDETTGVTHQHFCRRAVTLPLPGPGTAQYVTGH